MEASLTQISCKVKCKIPTCKHHFRKVVCKFVGTCKCGAKQEVVPPITHHKIEKQTVYNAIAKIHETLLNMAEKYAQESDLRLVANAVASVQDYLNPNQCYEDYLRETEHVKIEKSCQVKRKDVMTVQLTGFGAMNMWCGKRQTFGRPMMKDKWEGYVRNTGIGAPSFWSGKRTRFADQIEKLDNTSQKKRMSTEKKDLQEPTGDFDTKSLADTVLVQYLREYIKLHGYGGGLAVHGLLSSVISRAEAKGEQWARYYPDDESYDDATENIVIDACDGYDSDVDVDGFDDEP